MKTLVVLSALAAIAMAGPVLPGEDTTGIDFNKVGKRSPHLGLHKVHHVAAPIHPVPVVHHTFVQPVVTHHVGIKKPILFKHHGHHGLHYRTEDEELETLSNESKEAKTKCMKDMESKCEDEVMAKSSELFDGAQIEDVEDNVSESEVAQSLQMAKEAVNALQMKLQRAEKNSRMTQWKQGEFETDVKMQRDVETAKQALDQMQLNFGNLESMNVQATTFKEADVQSSHLELTKSEQERLAQWKDAIENIQKNVELVKNIEDSFQQTETTEMKSATFENNSSFKQAKNEDQSSLTVTAQQEQGSFNKDATEMRTEGKSADVKSSWKALTQEKAATIESSNLKSDMESSASTLSESSAALHIANEQHDQLARSEHDQSLSKGHMQSHHGHSQSSHSQSGHSQSGHSHSGHSHSSHSSHASTQSQLHHGTSSSHKIKHISMGHGNMKQSRNDEQSTMMIDGEMNDKLMESTNLVKTMKSSEGSENLELEKSAPVIDTTKLMKSADQQSQVDDMLNKENSEKTALRTEETMTFKNSALKHEDIENMETEQPKSAKSDNEEAIESQSTAALSSSVVQGKSEEHDVSMKSSDQMTGQSQQSEVTAKAMQHVSSGHQMEKSKHQQSIAAHGKSADGFTDGSFLPSSFNVLNAFKSSLDAPKTMTWKDATFHGSSRGAYGSGLSLGGGYGASGVGGGSSAVGVFPNAHVGGCAIPLLLSCSPNLVAGHLAKSHSYSAPSYAAPSYRNNEETNTHSKRDITKITTPTKVKRTPIRNLNNRNLF